MVIATYNVNGINGRLPVLIRWLKEKQPDVVCLQELKTDNEKFPEKALLKIGYRSIWHGQKSWNGVAVIAKEKFEMEEVGRGLAGDPEDLQSRFIEVMVNGILIICLYAPNGNPAPGPKFDYKMAWLKRLKLRSKKLVKLKTPVVLCGDYNIVPTDLDAYKPERWVKDAVFFPEPKKLYQQILKQGWTDAIRVLHPKKKIFTYWDYFRDAFNRNAGIRMDHFLLNPVLKKRLRTGGVHKEVRGWKKTSDHAPVWIRILNK